MEEVNKIEVNSIVMPVSFKDRTNASRDPLSSQALLSKLYYDYIEEENSEAYLNHLSDLARNPSLPPQVFSAIFKKLREYDFPSFRGKPPRLDALSCLFFNPLTSFDQVLNIVCYFNELNHFVNEEEIRKCKTVIEVFDTLITFVNVSQRVFFSTLLCSPMVSDKDFRSRARNIDFKHKINHWIVYSDPRFVPSSDDYKIAQDFATNQPSSDFRVDYARGTFVNPNADPLFLAQIVKHTVGQKSIEEAIYNNLNCPIELSAKFHLGKLESYKWKPSYLLKLEIKVNERLTLTSGEGPWADLPLAWKLEMVKE